MFSPRYVMTGGIACGKSRVARLFRDAGWEVLDADDVVHACESPGGAAVDEIVACFGAGIRAADGGIDRRKLAAIAFGDPAALHRLEAILHPLVRDRFSIWAAESGSCPCRRLAVVPLLFESGWTADWDFTLCVAADEDIQIDRMTRFRGMTEQESRARLSAQMPVREKAARAHDVIWNNGTPEALEREVWAVLARLDRWSGRSEVFSGRMVDDGR